MSAARFTQALNNRSVYVAKNKSILVPISCHVRTKTLEIRALLDSGATDCFISPETVKELEAPTKKLDKTKEVKNVDGTANVSGSIKEETYLEVSLNKKKKMLRFYIANIGKEQAILGYPFLESLEPPINWKEVTIDRTT